MNEMCKCEPTVPQSRIMAICKQLNALGSEVFELQKFVNENRTKYFGSQDVPDVSADKENSKGGIVNDIDCMIDDIIQRVLDVRKYVEIL